MSWTSDDVREDWSEDATDLAGALSDQAEPECSDCDGTGMTPAGDVCGCVDW